ncbi:hypothetical protein [Limnohabitans sp. DM1]|uniref:hypothetical protein n=1 Tax=Limnohabitans sp. DM1 TaxID=1597955 RepID=UPI001892C1A0|nr:hypothetical protein [Limnohabitans sp. DM1]
MAQIWNRRVGVAANAQGDGLVALRQGQAAFLSTGHQILLIAEGSQLVSATNQLKLPAVDKKYLTDVADTEQILRLSGSRLLRFARS